MGLLQSYVLQCDISNNILGAKKKEKVISWHVMCLFFRLTMDQLGWLVLSTWHQHRHIREDKIWNEKTNISIRLACRLVWGIVLINDWHRRSKPLVGSATPGLLVLGAIRKKVEQAVRSKVVSRTPPVYKYFSSCFYVAALSSGPAFS